jgi:hypothetical protein
VALNRTYYSTAQFANAGLQFLAGNFTFNGTGQPDAAEGKPFAVDGTDLVRTGVGDYVLTVPGVGAQQVLACIPAIEDSTLDLKVVIAARDDSARTVTFRITDGTDTEDDPTDGAKLHVLLVLASRQV